jgi:ABC-type transporter Mla subunit MlaD
MASDKSYARLGLFIVVVGAVIVATGLFFAQRMRTRKVISMVTYFAENVTGLDVSSPVRYRGVPVGRVSSLRIDPVGNMIEVDFQIFQDRLVALGTNLEHVKEMAALPIQPRLRASVVSNPISGEAYLLLDTLANPPPPPSLGFTPSGHYVPSMPSPLLSVQDRLPVIMDRAHETLKTLIELVQRIPASLDRSDRFLTNVEHIFEQGHLSKLSADLRSFSTTTTGQMAQITADMDRITSDMNHVMGDDGTLVKFANEARRAIRDAELPASTRSAREAADRTRLAADDLQRSLPAVLDALGELRELARSLEDQPESVVYGPRQPTKKPR